MLEMQKKDMVIIYKTALCMKKEDSITNVFKIFTKPNFMPIAQGVKT